MSPIDYCCLILIPVLLSSGQILFKKTANVLVTDSAPRFLVSILGNMHFWTALFVYGIATLLLIFVLSRVPLSKAMPFIALTFVIVPLVSAVSFGERLGPIYWIGVGLILSGVYVTVVAQPSR